jgi:hypothetical protein
MDDRALDPAVGGKIERAQRRLRLRFVFALAAKRPVMRASPPQEPEGRVRGFPFSNHEGGRNMTVARVTEISATSPQSFDDAVKQGLERANKTLRNVEGCWIKDMNVQVHEGEIKGYRVNMAVTFVLDD